MSEETLLMSIGYGRRSIGEFIDALRERGVAYVVDVRSKPFARNPEFTRDALAAHLAAAGVAYLFLGGQLGGIPNDSSCYDDNGRVDYSKCRRRPAFLEGLARLIRAHELGLRVACRWAARSAGTSAFARNTPIM